MKRLLLLMALSLGLGLGGLYLATRDALLDPQSYALETWSWPLALAAVLAFLSIWVVPAVKHRDLVAEQGRSLTLYQSLLVHVASVFGVAMTPSGSGGGPALMVALGRFGVPTGVGLGIAMQVAVLDLIAFAILIPVGSVYLLMSGAIALSPAFRALAVAGATVAAIGAVALSRYPRPVVRLLLWLSRLRKLRRFADRIQGAAREYYRSAKAFQAMPLWRWGELVLITVLSWLANFLLFWVALRMYGIPAGAMEIVSVLSVLTLASFVIPTPGGSGFMEFVVGLAVSGRVTAAEVAPPILVWRLLTFYLIFLIGPVAGWLILLERAPRWLRRWLPTRDRRDRDDVEPRDGSHERG